MTSLLQEIISVYTLLNPSQLTAAASNRVCNALALLQCVASHNETRALFLNGMKMAPLGRQFTDQNSAHPFIFVSFSKHDFEIASFRISTIDVSRRHRRLG